MLQFETERAKDAAQLFAVYRRTPEGGERFVRFCDRSELARWAGWPCVIARRVETGDEVVPHVEALKIAAGLTS